MNAPAPRFGKYQILQTLGSGAMGVVYLAYDPVIERQVAVKTIGRALLEGERVGATERFRLEASAAGRLAHPGIVAVYDYGEDGDVAYIVMEYAPGLELGAYVANKSLSLPEVGSLMGQLLDALGYAHAAGVVHRDVKPANILVSDRLKITDFGVARIENAIRSQTGLIVGTPSYMAPEQFMGKGVDHRSDLFAAGVILYELLTGARPFGGESLEELAYKICHTEPVAATSLNAKLPRGIDAVLAKALAKAKEARFAAAAEFSRAMRDALSGGSGPEPRGPTLESAVVPSTASTAWGAEVLLALEGVLLPVIGSVARIMVRRNASRTGNAVELLSLLNESLDGEPTRAALVEQLRSVLGVRAIAVAPAKTARSLTAPVEPTTSITPEAIERVTLALANYVGPIARVMTRKAVAASANYLELCLRLSERLSSEDEKARFLEELGIPLGA